MRRSLVISLFAALIVIGAAAGPAPSSAAAGASSAVICPLAGPSATCCGPPINIPATATVLSCCPQPPSTLCCPITAACVTPMTISSSPNPSVEGSAVTVSGRVPGAAPGTAVTLWQELPGQQSFRSVARARTSSTSTYALRIGRSAVKTNRAWYIASGGATSSTIEQVVKAKLTVSVKAVTLAHGQRITLSGKIDPTHSGQRVLLEQKVSGSWRALAHARLNRKSRYTIGHRWAHPGVVKLRIALAADQRNAASFSSVATLTLTG